MDSIESLKIFLNILLLMIIIPDKFFFFEVVADAVTQAHLTCRSKQTRNRWIKAIAKAAAVILQDDTTFLHWEPNQEILYFWSADSNESIKSRRLAGVRLFSSPKENHAITGRCGSSLKIISNA